MVNTVQNPSAGEIMTVPLPSLLPPPIVVSHAPFALVSLFDQTICEPVLRLPFQIWGVLPRTSFLPALKGLPWT
jgi:hypothetical protein